MSTDALIYRLHSPKRTLGTIQPSPHTAAKVAGFLYLFAMAATNAFAALRFLIGAGELRTIDTKLLLALARLFLSV